MENAITIFTYSMDTPSTPRNSKIGSIEQLENSPWGHQAADPKVLAALPGKVKSFIGRVGKDSPIARRAAQAVDLLSDNMKSGEGGSMFNARNAVILGAALLYLLCPIDFIPDAIPVVGWLDDLGVLALALSYLRPSSRPFESTSAQEDPAKLDEMIATVAPNHQGSAVQLCGDLQKKLRQVHEEVAKLDDAELLARLDDLDALTLDPMRRVIVTGGFSTGKSSIINRLLGDDCLPVSAIPTTPVLTTLMHGKELYGVVHGKDSTLESVSDMKLLRDVSSPVMRGAQEIVVYHPADILDKGFSIVDTPGIQEVNYQIPFEEMPRSDAFVFVTSTEAGDLSKKEADFLAHVAENGLVEQLIVIVNKTDCADAKEVEDIVSAMKKALLTRGLENVPFFRLRHDGGAGDELSALRTELLRRATDSMQAAHEADVRQALDGIHLAIGEEKRHRDELVSLSEQQQAARRVCLDRLRQRVIDTVARRSDTLKLTSKADLHAFLHDTLRPKVYEIINNAKASEINEQLPGRLTACIRESLRIWLDGECRDISQKLGSALSDDDRAQIIAVVAELGLPMPENPAGDMAKYANYILPAISIATFFPMGIFAWITTIAVPTFLMDKLGVGTAVEKLIRMLGIDGARRKLREQISSGLDALETSIAGKLEELIDSGSEQVKSAQQKALEMTI